MNEPNGVPAPATPSLADLILAHNDREGTPVFEWGQQLQIVPMSGIDRDSYEREIHADNKAGRSLHNFRARFVVRCLCDIHGNRVFTNAQAEQLGTKNGETIIRLWEIAEGKNKTAPKAVETDAKNF